jgi:PPK2 family polyphosphate:nucleotide phosphotransferase
VKKLEKLVQSFLVPPGKKISLKDYDPGDTADLMGKKKEEAANLLQKGLQLLSEYQDKLYAQDTYALLIVLQAMDAAGKDSVIKHVMSGLNPQGCQVYNFKTPSTEELNHDYLWRNFKALPERGRIGIFNRSYYEEVLVVRVHPEILEHERLPAEARAKDIWTRRFEEMNNFEKYLVANGIVVVKFFLNVSRDEQEKRFLERIDQPEKNWKFSLSDAKERAFWGDYMRAYEDVFNHTSTRWAPWYIIPADHKWFTRLAVAAAIVAKMKEINPEYPKMTQEQEQELLKAKAVLLNEPPPQRAGGSA